MAGARAKVRFVDADLPPGWYSHEAEPAANRSDDVLATPNYSYEKRQRELAKKRQKEEKRLRKQNRGAADTAGEAEAGPGEAAAAPDESGAPQRGADGA